MQATAVAGLRFDTDDGVVQSKLAAKLRQLLGPAAILYSNECIPSLVHGGNASWDAVTIPPDLSLISVDIYGGYLPGGHGSVPPKGYFYAARRPRK